MSKKPLTAKEQLKKQEKRLRHYLRLRSLPASRADAAVLRKALIADLCYAEQGTVNSIALGDLLDQAKRAKEELKLLEAAPHNPDLMLALLKLRALAGLEERIEGAVKRAEKAMREE